MLGRPGQCLGEFAAGNTSGQDSQAGDFHQRLATILQADMKMRW